MSTRESIEYDCRKDREHEEMRLDGLDKCVICGSIVDDDDGEYIGGEGFVCTDCLYLFDPED